MEIAVPAIGWSSSSSSSSSIGEDSDRRSDGEDSSGEEEEEVESPNNKGPMWSLDSLEEALPVRRGLSRFYNGQVKSFTGLSSHAITSASAIVKPENAYTRRRRNQLAKKIMLSSKTPPGNVLMRAKERKISKKHSIGHSSHGKLQDGKKRSLLLSDLKELVASSSPSSSAEVIKKCRTTSTGDMSKAN